MHTFDGFDLTMVMCNDLLVFELMSFDLMSFDLMSFDVIALDTVVFEAQRLRSVCVLVQLGFGPIGLRRIAARFIVLVLVRPTGRLLMNIAFLVGILSWLRISLQVLGVGPTILLCCLLMTMLILLRMATCVI